MTTVRLLVSLAAAVLAFAQTKPISVVQTNPISDLYYIVFLRPDPARKSLSAQEMDRIQAAHMANIQSMAANGVLVAAGPFDDAEPKISGLFVFRAGPGAASLEMATSLAQRDPTVSEQRNTAEVFSWHGPRGLGQEYARLHKADPATPEDMGIQPLWMLWRGPSWDERSPVLAAHRQYLEGLRRKGKLATTGSVDSNPAGLTELTIFQRIPPAEARALIEADPAVKAGMLRAEYHGWYCAAHVLPQVLQL